MNFSSEYRCPVSKFEENQATTVTQEAKDTIFQTRVWVDFG